MKMVDNALLELLRSGRTHAVVLAGSPAVARTLAESAATVLLEIDVATLGRHPNYLSLERPVDKKTEEKKSQIPVDDVVEFCARLALSSFGAGKKIAVIHDADALNAHGQNALLKTLEEPKGDTLVMLLAEYPDRLLPTIRSRASEIVCSAITPADDAVAAEAASFLAATKTDRLLAAVALTKGDEAASAEHVQAFVAELGRVLHATLLAKCATMNPDTLRAHARVLALLGDAPRALRDNGAPTLVLEAVALALP